MKLTISPTLGELPTIDYRSLTDLQGNLKDLHQKEFDKLKKSLFGTEAKPKMFDFPLYVCEIKGTNYIFDGHQRLRVLKTLNAEPFELPCVFVEAKSLKEAKEKLLTLNSNYGKVTKEGFDEFVATDFDIDFVTDFTTFDGFMDFEDVTQETDYSDKNKEVDLDDELKSQIVLNYTSEEFIKVKTALSKIAQTPEQAVYLLLFENE